MQLLVSVVALSSAGTRGTSPPLDVYPPLHDFSIDKGVPAQVLAASPDPLIAHVWNSSELSDPLAYQSFVDYPDRADASPSASFQGVESLTNPKAKVTVKGKGSLRVRFEQEGACWVEFDSPDLTPEVVKSANIIMGISENRIPGPLGMRGPVDHTAAQGLVTYRLEANKDLYDGVRYAFLNITSAPANPFTVTSFRRVCQAVPMSYTGGFASSDSLLNRVYYVGAYTARVNIIGNGLSKGGYLGSELMDRGDRIAFLGDSHVAQQTVLAAFSSADPDSATRRVLRRNSVYCGGIGNGIRPYDAMYVLSVVDLFDWTGNATALLSVVGPVEKKLAKARDSLFPKAVSNASASFDWSRDDPRMGFGFESPNIPEAQRAYTALCVEAFRRWSGALRAAGNQTGADTWAKAAADAAEAVRSAPGWMDAWGMHSSADAVNAGLVSDDEARALVAEPNGRFASGRRSGLTSLSNFESSFVLRALGSINASRAANFLVRRHWAAMLASGATTTWERNDPIWTDAGAVRTDGSDDPPVNAMNDKTSMAHPWGSGATGFLSRYVSGIRATSPGFATLDMMPWPADYLDDEPADAFLEGWLMTPRGRAKVSLRPTVAQPDEDSVTVRIEFDVPSGCRATVGVPKMWASSNGSPLPELSALRRDGGGDVPLGSDPRFVVQYVTASPQGKTVTFTATYSLSKRLRTQRGQNQPNWSLGNFTYPARVSPIDRQTSGDWTTAYGGQGFVLFNASADSTDKVSLPSWVNAVHAAPRINPQTGGPAAVSPKTTGRPLCSKTHAVYACAYEWSTSTMDPRALAPAGGGSGPRVAAAVSAGHWASFHIDIILDSPRAYNASLYMVDFDRTGTSQALQIMDRETLETVAPLVVVDDFRDGAYVTLSYNRSVRVRVLEVHSMNGGDINGLAPRVLVSGVFFQ